MAPFLEERASRADRGRSDLMRRDRLPALGERGVGDGRTGAVQCLDEVADGEVAPAHDAGQEHGNEGHHDEACCTDR